MLAAAAFFLLSGSVIPLIMVSSLSFGIFIAVSRTTVKDLKPSFGWANTVTLCRLAILLIASFFHASFPPSYFMSILILLILLDWFDGYLARRLNQRTEFGARFDCETDALYVCLTGCILYLTGRAPGWILVPAFLRYAFVVIARLFNLHEVPERRTRPGPVIAVAMFSTLAAAFVLPEAIRLTALLLSSIAVTGSFLYSFGLLLTVKYARR